MKWNSKFLTRSDNWPWYRGKILPRVACYLPLFITSEKTKLKVLTKAFKFFTLLKELSMKFKQEKLLPGNSICKVQKKIQFWKTKQEKVKTKMRRKGKKWKKSFLLLFPPFSLSSVLTDCQTHSAIDSVDHLHYRAGNAL